MAKKRSCRRTVNEDKVHEKAVKIRKMTDEQLVQYVKDVYKRQSQSRENVQETHSKKRRCHDD